MKRKTVTATLLLLASCSAPVPNPIDGTPIITMEDALRSPSLGALLEGAWHAPYRRTFFNPSLQPPQVPGVHVNHCDGATRPAPFLQYNVSGDPYGPVVNQECFVTFWTCAMPLNEPVTPDACWIIVGHEWQDPRLLTELNLPGCWLLVKNEGMVAVPVTNEWSGMLRRDQETNGRMMLRWTPSASAFGQDVYLQLLVYRPGISSSGFQLSQGLHLRPGSPGGPGS